MKQTALNVILLILMILVVPSAIQAQTQDNVTHVINGKEPANNHEKLELEELWRVGDDEGEIFFGLISDVDVGLDGNYYVLDAQLDEIKVISPDGDFLRTIGRSGEGPGEFRGGFTLALLPDGTFGVAQAFPGKLVGLKPDGNPRPDIPIVTGKTGDFISLGTVHQGGNNLVISAAKMAFDPKKKEIAFQSFIQCLDEKGNLGVKFYDESISLKPGEKFYEKDYVKLERPFAVAQDGRLVLVPHADQYMFEIYNPNGNLELTVSRENENWERVERAQYFAYTDMRMVGKGLGLSNIQIDDEEREIFEVQWRDDSTVWVLTGKNAYFHAPGEFRYEVFDKEGQFDRKVRIFVEGDPNLDKLIFIGSDRILLLRGFRDSLYKMGELKRPWTDSEPISPVELVCYRIK